MSNVYNTPFNDIASFKLKEFLAYNDVNWSFIEKATLSTVYNAAQSGTDTDAEDWVSSNRMFIVNNDPVDRILKLNGTSYTFVAGDIYACSADEASFFLNQASAKGYGISYDTSSNWITGGELDTFFE